MRIMDGKCAERTKKLFEEGCSALFPCWESRPLRTLKNFSSLSFTNHVLHFLIFSKGSAFHTRVTTRDLEKGCSTREKSRKFLEQFY
jgi:hypothetical protein